MASDGAGADDLAAALVASAAAERTLLQAEWEAAEQLARARARLARAMRRLERAAAKVARREQAVALAADRLRACQAARTRGPRPAAPPTDAPQRQRLGRTVSNRP